MSKKTSRWSSFADERLTPVIATLYRRHFSVLRPIKGGVFRLVP